MNDLHLVLNSPRGLAARNIVLVVDRLNDGASAGDVSEGRVIVGFPTVRHESSDPRPKDCYDPARGLQQSN